MNIITTHKVTSKKKKRTKESEREMSSIGRLSSVTPTETLDIENGLSLVPRLKLLLTINRSDLSVNPIDEWQFKRSLLDYLKTSFSIPYIVPEEDLIVHKYKDLKKRKREDPVASGVLYVRDLGFLNRNKFNKEEEQQKEEVVEEDEEEGEVKKQKKKDLEKKFVEWRDSFVEKLDGIELNLKGVKFRLNVKIPKSDDFELLKKSWEEYYAFNSKGYSSRGGRQQPDTLVVRGLPSRWFAEPRVSSKPSMLVTHTIFSVFGKIRKLNVGTDDDLGENVDEGSGDIVPGLHCKIVVQFEKHDDFYNALKVLCGRSMQKEGSRLRADYEAIWDRNDLRDTLQRTARNQIPERGHMQLTGRRHHDNETPRSQPQIGRFGSNDVHPKRFKE